MPKKIIITSSKNLRMKNIINGNLFDSCEYVLLIISMFHGNNLINKLQKVLKGDKKNDCSKAKYI